MISDLDSENDSLMAEVTDLELEISVYRATFQSAHPGPTSP